MWPSTLGRSWQGPFPHTRRGGLRADRSRNWRSSGTGRGVWHAGRIFLVLALALPLLAGDTGPAPKPSSFAPTPDLSAQIDWFIKQLESDLASAAGYGKEQRERVAKDANTLIVLAQVLASHDEDHPLRTAAASLVPAARELADAADDFAGAKTALTAVKSSLRAAPGATEGPGARLEPVAELSQLMKQVPIVNNRLRLGVTGKRFDRSVDQNAGLATTLAAIAHASAFDTAYCSNKEQESTWVRICAEMRSAAAEVQFAVRRKDQSAAKVGLDKLVKTCDACHADFRD
jgi:hypothetical protein